VGQILTALDRRGLAGDTLVVFTSDNGPVVDDGYRDEAVEKLGTHRPAGPLRGGKYSAFDAGTRVPFIARWPRRIAAGRSPALVSQIDFLSSFAALTGQGLEQSAAPDSLDVLPALLGSSDAGRAQLVEQAAALSLIAGDWKYIEPNGGARVERGTDIELGNDPEPQLYDLSSDIGERRNLAPQHPEKVRALAEELRKIRERGRSRQ
jgi:arylsulfatase A-like enzyme